MSGKKSSYLGVIHLQDKGEVRIIIRINHHIAIFPFTDPSPCARVDASNGIKVLSRPASYGVMVQSVRNFGWQKREGVRDEVVQASCCLVQLSRNRAGFRLI